ncbi:MAG TPA: TRAP transporter small permease subunit [Dehalococcoidia bacterium]|nr:TRAP transporter small permease subunit [Dehalococcoidia bacterium]
MKKFIHTVDFISEWTALTGRWFIVALVVLVTAEVTLRYVFTKPTLWGYELHVMLAASAYILAFAYTHRHRAHVRVDMIYAHLPPRGQAVIDFLGTLLLFFPFIFMLCFVAWSWQYDSWVTGEKMPITGWYPPAGPLRTVIFYGLCLFALQAVVHFIRDTYLMIRGKPYD